MATCVTTFSAHTSTVTGPSLGPPTFASFAGHWPGRICCIARVKPSAVHVGGIGKPVTASGPVGKTRAGWQISKARRLHVRRLSRKGGPPREDEEGRGPRLAGIRKLDRVMPPSRVIAETNRRHLASNKLAKRTSKKVAGACERWPSWSLFSGATRGEGTAKRCPDARLRGEQCPGVSRGSGSVLQAPAGGWFIARWTGRVPRASSPSREGVGADGSIRRVPVRGRCLGSLQGVSFSRGGVGSGLGLLPRFRAAQPPPNGAWCSVGQAKAAPPRTAGGRRQGHQRFDRAVAVGRKRPRLAVPPVRRPLEDLRSSSIHRSVHRGVKPRSTSGPRKRRRVVPQSPALEIPRTHEMRVFVSTVWMAEVGP